MADTWTVTAQRQTTQLDSGGLGFTDVMEVTFRTKTNVVGKVYVPLVLYSAAKVAEEINEFVAHIDQVNEL